MVPALSRPHKVCVTLWRYAASRWTPVAPKLRGRARGGGAELAMAADMCFAAAGRTWLSLYEVRAGAIPGGGGPRSGRSKVRLTRVSA
jgi:enoyl-CoA hydratase/carnithine racemase